MTKSSPRRQTSREKKRYRAILCVLSGVVANVPVSNCAIVTAVRKAAKYNNKDLSDGELILLSFIKVPCAIDFIAKNLVTTSTRTSRNRVGWINALKTQSNISELHVA